MILCSTLMSMTGYYPHAAQDFHIAGNVVLREIGCIITNLSLNITDRAANMKCASHLNIKSFLKPCGINVPRHIRFIVR